MTSDSTVGGRTAYGRLTRAFDDQSSGLDRFGAVLALTITSVVMLSFVDISNLEANLPRALGSLLAALLVGATLTTALRASGLTRRRQRIIDTIIVLVILGYSASVLVELMNRGLPGSALGVSGVITSLSVLAPVVVVLRLLRHREVTAATMLGAIAAYLLIGLAFFWLFFSIGNSHGFFATPQSSSSYMYFSLTTLTTTGYGDLTAQGNLGRLLANAEAVVGQVYLVTFVAMIVGLRVASWRREPESHGDGDGAVDAGPAA